MEGPQAVAPTHGAEKSAEKSETVAVGHSSVVDISFAPASAADDAALVTRLTDLINVVYSEAETGFWKGGFVRTTQEEVRELLRAGEIALAWARPQTATRATAAGEHNHNDNNQDDAARSEVLVGCIRVHLLDPHTGEFGMLACDPAHRGSGVGRALLRFAEDAIRRRGAATIRLELLVGDGWTHDFKARLGRWYEREGYAVVRTSSVWDSTPHLAPLLAGPSLFQVYQKKVAAE
ncbi:hypothetical protein VTK73DRAFT_3656 [Phialemonium thermophilum]|uniref:N-acetyltransferase domain-containing protein n=1 Tax=Phialemonium thermophilum TaxID=223376 RepID=A0ABR3WXV5_9PEZI